MIQNSFINSVNRIDGNFLNFSYVDKKIIAYNTDIVLIKHAIKKIKSFALKYCSLDDTENILIFQNSINETYNKKYEIIENKKTLLHHYYNTLINTEIKPKNNLYFTNNDKNVYFAIDDRFNLSKWNLKVFLKKLLLKGQIKPNEYKKYIRYGKQSDNIKRHIYFYLTHNLLKVKTLKNKYLMNIKPRHKNIISMGYLHIPIKSMGIVENIPNIKLIVSELKLKQQSEQNIYVYSKIDNQ